MVVFALYEKAHSQRMMNIPKKPLTMIPSWQVCSVAYWVGVLVP